MIDGPRPSYAEGGRKVRVLISSEAHPAFMFLKTWGRADQIATRKDDLERDGILFLISCTEIIDASFRSGFDAVIVLHASDLPQGRGWSPHIWQILEGKDRITVTALSAEDRVDTGAIWAQEDVSFSGTELHDEINERVFAAECRLIERIARDFDVLAPRPQEGEASYYRKRTPADSELDPEKSILEQIDTLRVADPDRYPAFFEYKGKKFKIILQRYD